MIGTDRNQRELIEKAQAGHVAAFEALIGEYIPQVRRFARAHTSNESEADDLAQDALVKVYKSLGGYRFQAAFSTWLYTIVRSVFIDSRRSLARREQLAQKAYGSQKFENHPTSPENSPPTPLEEVSRAQTRRALWAAIGRLPDKFRVVLVLSDVEGLSQEEIAVRENVAVGTVKSRLNRARTRLRGILEGTPLAPEALSGNPEGAAYVSPVNRGCK